MHEIVKHDTRRYGFGLDDVIDLPKMGGGMGELNDRLDEKIDWSEFEGPRIVRRRATDFSTGIQNMVLEIIQVDCARHPVMSDIAGAQDTDRQPP